MAVVVPLLKRGDVVYKAPYLTSMPRYAPRLADAVADVNTLLLDIQTVDAYPITKGNPLGITSYSDPAIAAWSGAPPDPAKTFRIASADAMKSVFLRAEFVTKPLSLKEIEFCTGEAAGQIISGMRVRGETSFVTTDLDDVNPDVKQFRAYLTQYEYSLFSVHAIPFRGKLDGENMAYCRAILFISSALMIALMYDISDALGKRCILTYFYDADTNDPEVVLPTGNNLLPPMRDLRMIKNTIRTEYLYVNEYFLHMLTQLDAAGNNVYKLDDVLKNVDEEKLFEPQYQRFKRRTFWLRHVQRGPELDLSDMKVLFCVAEEPMIICGGGGLSSIDFPYVLASAIPSGSDLSCRETRANDPLMPLEDSHTIPGTGRIFPDRESALDYLRGMMRKS